MINFAIVIPNFNKSHFLTFALDSLRHQSAPFNLAVMDGGSTDGFKDVIQHYSGIISYWRSGPDEGQSTAIQEGWDNTDGEIVAWLCSDDYYFPDTLDAVKSVFTRHPEVDVVYGDAVFINRAGHFLGYFPEITSNISLILKGDCIAQPSCFVRRTALEEIGRLNSDLHYIMDWDLWTRLYKSGAKFHYLNKPLSVVRMYKSSKTSSRSWRRFFEIARHLWMNTTKVTAVKSLIGFYYQNLLSSDVAGYEFLMLKALNFYRRQKRHFQDKNGRIRRFNYGLSPYGNKAENTVDVFMPWYNKFPPALIRVRCDLEAAPDAYLNGLHLSAKRDTQFCYEMPVIDISSNILHLRISSSTGKAWRLQVVEFN